MKRLRLERPVPLTRRLLIGLGLLPALILAACGDDDSAGPTATGPGNGGTSPAATARRSPTPTISPVPGERSLDDFRPFAAELQRAITARDGAFILSHAEQANVDCQGTEELGPCAEKPAGTTIQGVWDGLWRTDAVGLSPPEDIASRFQAFVTTAQAGASDAYGSGEAKLYALAASDTGIFQGTSSAYAILTGIFSEPQPGTRRALVYMFALRGAEWKLSGVIEGGVLYQEWLSGACDGCYDEWERWEETTP